MNKNNSSQSGVALLMSLGILALLSILGVAFSTNMRLMERTTRDFVYDMQARYLAEGGVEYAIAELKDDARSNFVYNDNVPIADQTGLLPDSSGSINNITIVDTARQVNINNANINLLDCLPGIGSDKGQAIIDARNIAPFITKKSICLASGVGSGTYENIKDLFTTYTYIDSNVQNTAGELQDRSAINVNTVDVDSDLFEDIIAKVDSDNAETISNNIISTKPINSWTQFNNISGMTDNVKEAFNPNRKKSSSYYSTFPTEFCFHSGGTYEVTATGTVTKGSGGTSQTVAQKTINTIVEIFDLWNQTTKEQFRGEDADYDGVLDTDPKEDKNGNNQLDVPDYERVTWFDSCPVRTGQDWNTTGGYDTIENSLKLGYWDDFDDANYSNAQWHAYTGMCYEENNIHNHPTVFRIRGSFPRIDLYDEHFPNRWNFGVQFIQTQVWDVLPGIGPGTYNTGDHGRVVRLCFRGEPGISKDSSILHSLNSSGQLNDAFELWERENELNIHYKDEDPPYTIDEATGMPYPWVYGSRENFANKWVKWKVWCYSNIMNAIEDCGNIVYKVHLNSEAQNNNGVVRIYAHYSDPYNGAWLDNMRIIPTEGNYTSISLRPENYPVEWGIIYGTVTIPATAKASSETVKFQTSADSYSKNISPPSGAISSNNSDTIKYKVILETKETTPGATPEDYKPFETPVLEDVWVTYLPKTKIKYWREN